MGFSVVKAGAKHGRQPIGNTARIAPNGRSGALIRIDQDVAASAGIKAGAHVLVMKGSGEHEGQLGIAPTIPTGMSIETKQWGKSTNVVIAVNCEAIGIVRPKPTTGAEVVIEGTGLILHIPEELRIRPSAVAA